MPIVLLTTPIWTPMLLFLIIFIMVCKKLLQIAHDMFTQAGNSVLWFFCVPCDRVLRFCVYIVGVFAFVFAIVLPWIYEEVCNRVDEVAYRVRYRVEQTVRISSYACTRLRKVFVEDTVQMSSYACTRLRKVCSAPALFAREPQERRRKNHVE
jgi:hypothetical protein